MKAHPTLIYLLLLFFFFAGAIWLVNPVGNFPLNDDWSYAQTVQRLVQDGEYRLTGWTSMPLLTQVFWGSLFTQLFGFSFTALRFSTLLLSFCGGLFSFFLLRKLATEKLAFFTSLLLLFNPLWFHLSFTFMTDVPFVALMAVAVFLFAKVDEAPLKYGSLMVIFLVLATLLRQTGLIVSVAIALSLLLSYRWRKNWLLPLLTFLLPLLILLLYNYWLEHNDLVPMEYHRALESLHMQWELPIITSISKAYWRVIKALLYLAIFTLPLLISPLLRLLKGKSERPKWIALIVVLLLMAPLLVSLVLERQPIPLLANTIYNFGLGAPTMRDVSLLGLPHLPALPYRFMVVFTGLQVLAGTLLLWVLFMKLWLVRQLPLRQQQSLLFALLFFGGYLFTISYINYFDRYLLPLLLPLVLVLVIGERQLHLSGLCILLFMPLAWFSVAGTHDYLARNRTKWEALMHLTQKQHIPPQNIDGGFEFSGWHLYEEEYQQQEGKSWWWVQDDEYLLSLGPVKGYEVWRSYTYPLWLAAADGQVLVLKREKKAFQGRTKPSTGDE